MPQAFDWIPAVRAVFQIAPRPPPLLSPVNREQYRQFRVTVAGIALCERLAAASAAQVAPGPLKRREGHRSRAKTPRLRIAAPLARCESA